jgi:ferredoxin
VTSAIISPADLATLVDDLVAARTSVVGPVPAADGSKRTEYRRIERLEQSALGGPLERHSLKEFFLPPTEVLLRYRQRKDGVDLEEVPTTFTPQVILGARPCDAAGVEILDRVMNWDYRDELWFGRREATTIVSLACPVIDSLCFCGAVGLGPDSTKGADALLVPLGAAPGQPWQESEELKSAREAFLRDAESFPRATDHSAARHEPLAALAYVATALTPKGEALLKGVRRNPASPAALKLAEEFVKMARGRIRRNVAPERWAGLAGLPEWLANNFDHPLWKSLALRCHGCGACAAVCPTCHCFDIVDEHDDYVKGTRRRIWDSCQTAKFSLHASGHNPRATQNERFRQRMMHKFSIYPRRFDAILCTGCGRCARMCPAGMNLPEILGQIVQLAGPAAQGSAR